MARPTPIRAEVPEWYAINASSDKKTADVYIYDAIGGWLGVDARSFVSEVTDLDVDSINLYVNSPGGSVWDGIAIANVLRRHKAHVVATVDGLAASAASFIIQAADEIVMGRGTELMIHDASGICLGNAKDMADTGAILERISDDIAGLYADRAGGTAAEWREAMREETWYSAAEAVEAGLADRVDKDREETDAENVFDLSVFAHAGRSDAPDPFMPDRQPAARASDHPRYKKGGFTGDLHYAARATDVNYGTTTVKNDSGQPETVLTRGQRANTRLAALAAAFAPWPGADAPPADHVSAHKPPAEPVEPNQEGADTMSDTLMKGIRDRLGVPADAEMDEDQVLNALDEVLTEQTSGEPQGQVVPEGTVILDSDEHQRLVADAQEGRQARADRAVAEREQTVDAAISDGRIPPARREHWLNQLEADPGASEVLAALTPGTIPVDAQGYVGGVDESPDEDTAIYSKLYKPEEA